MRAAWAVFAVVVVSACVQAGDVPCDQGRVCPNEYTCKSYGCASPDQVKACAGKSTDDECSFANQPGHCLEEACVISICGNGKVEPGEVCDDGNTVSGDLCSGTCTSDESCGNGIIELAEECDLLVPDPTKCDPVECKIVRCGNGIVEPGEDCDDGGIDGGDGCSFTCAFETCGNDVVDFLAGEQCDDGNHRSFDGCNAGCELERLSWLPVDASTSTPSPTAGAAAYDSGRQRFVIFGGLTAGIVKNETWELDGASWTRVLPDISPPARTNAAMTFDRKLGRVVLFGGQLGGSTPSNDTWEYDGIVWRQITTQHSPPSRHSHRLAYDSARERVVLFGGSSGPGNLNDTWEYDGVDWVQTTLDSVSASPERRSSFAMEYDPVRGRVVVYGGIGTSFLNDTWQYDGTSWTAVTGTSPSAGRGSAALVFDVARGQLVLSGGVNGSGTVVNDTWTLGSSGWTVVAGATPGRYAHSAAYDPRRRTTILYGGVDTSVNYAPTLLELVGTTWSALTVQLPLGKYDAAAAFDPTRGEVVVFGGTQNLLSGAVSQDLWALGEHAWHPLPATTKPSQRQATAMAFDAARHKLVLFGGNDGTYASDTWEYDGTAWTQRFPATVPPGRMDHQMVYDSGRRRIQMFGGHRFGPAVDYDDFWEWDGTNWTEITATPKPPARSLFAMAYDAAHTRTIVWGGKPSSVGNATWIFDGTAWTTFSSAVPPWIGDSVAAYDAARDRVVMHGGGESNAPTNSTWELSGTTWTAVPEHPTDPPRPAASLHAMAYDAAHQRVVLFGGARDTINTGLVYTFGPEQSVPAEGCRAGVDLDGDMKAGCADDDCWGICTPLCPPGSTSASCSMLPRCGDSTCDTVESCRTCPADCVIGGSSCPVECGDGFCDSAEAVATCPGDCG